MTFQTVGRCSVAVERHRHITIMKGHSEFNCPKDFLSPSNGQIKKVSTFDNL